MDLIRAAVPPLVPPGGVAGHAVQFYDRNFAAASIAGFLGESLRAGGAAVVIARPEHQEAIVAALAADGSDPHLAIAARRLVLLDAADTLAALCVDGEPSPEGLRREVAPLLGALLAAGRPVRAYGEMVDLLAREGRVGAAVALETAWNDLLANYPVELLCGYEIASFDEDGGGDFGRVCGCHDQVLVREEEATGELGRDRLVAELEHKTRVARMAAEQLARQHAITTRLYEEANAAREEAERASRAKDEFLAMLGHELRNPLSPIVNALHLMRLRGSGELERERALIERQVAHLRRLVEDLLDVSRITRGKLQLEHKAVEIAEVVAQALETVSPLAAQRAHHLVVEVPSDGLLVEGDSPRLAQVFANLLMNAAKYTPSEGRLEVRAVAQSGEAVVTIRDNGIGIAPELVPSVFDLFVQGPRAFDRSEGGLGLGLAIVHSLVQLHGGSVTVHSAGIGRGAEFTVRLPLALSSRRIHSAAADPSARVGGHGHRVLVVDDNVDAANTLAELLEAMGCEAKVAFDGPAALMAAQDMQPRLVLLDIGLPLMDGYEVAARLRAAGFDGRLVALTGYGQPEDRERSRRAGFDEHYVKPLAPEVLYRLIASLASSEPA